jgi:hypothetical protein
MADHLSSLGLVLKENHHDAGERTIRYEIDAV